MPPLRYSIALLKYLFGLIFRELREHGDKLICTFLFARKCWDTSQIIAAALGLMLFNHCSQAGYGRLHKEAM